MLYKILIVDDEPIICRGLKDTIPWEKYNVEVIGTAFDGGEAIRIIKQTNDVDIVLTDVRMPNIDGIQLATYLCKQHPRVRTIIISGYDEFAYAQKAVKLGVEDYILKPVDIDELVQKIIKITNEIEQERKEAKNVYLTNLKNVIFQQISGYPGTTQESKYKHVTIYPFITMHQDYIQKVGQQTSDEIANFKYSWRNSIDDLLNKNGFESMSIFTHENLLLTCIKVNKEQGILEEILSIVSSGIHNINSLWFIGSDRIIHLSELKKEFKKLKDEVKYVATTHSSIFHIVGHHKYDGTKEYPYELESKLIDSVFRVEESKLKHLSDDLFDYFKDNDYFLEEIVQVCREILLKISNRYESLVGKNSKQLTFLYKRDIDVYIYNSYEILQKLFLDDLFIVTEKLDLEKIRKDDWIIKQAVEYIKEYYHTDIKVQEVAEVVNISPNYFSSIFKQVTGKYFKEYINQLRIDEAKSLLAETPFKVREIAEQVGFHEYKYFVEVFKKFTGMTPTDYRKIKSIT